MTSNSEPKQVTSSRSPVANPTYSPMPRSLVGYRSFREFYPFYLGQHSHPLGRRLHFVGTTIAIVYQLRVLVSLIPSALRRLRLARWSAKLDALKVAGGRKSQVHLCVFGILQACIWSWSSHLLFERNKPPAFSYPIYSLLGDLMLWKESGEISDQPPVHVRNLVSSGYVAMPYLGVGP
ncbi:hypothetical protein FRB95_007032 [Tulasnella sp. JGI-2019a]|nr:hypothetical protein FRB93_010262 [Tulasnella sp. JGI-2019a]KAG9027955.1 hypothetical protein FRB95_007032 [Tulasnella sp. JGI-2019a]